MDAPILQQQQQQPPPQQQGEVGRALVMLEGADEHFRNLVTRFSNYLDRDGKDNRDAHFIQQQLVRQRKNRLLVNIDHVRQYDRDLANLLLDSPMDSIPAFTRALTDIMTLSTSASLDFSAPTYHVGLFGSFGAHHANPRTLQATNIGTLVALEGIVTRCSLVRPKMLKSVHYCDATHLFTTREYRDATMLGEGLPTGTMYPTTDEHGNPLTTEFGYCTFRDHQTIALQEMPERAPPGQLPRSIDVILDDDLVDACKPGDRVQIVGVYRAVSGGVATGTFRAVVLANNVRQLDKEVAHPTLTELDLRNIRAIARKESVVDLLTRSLAPSIFGHYWVKKALLMQLLGGLEHNLANGTHIRGDINVLLLGDPSTAKSQFLRFVMQMAPLAIATTGRGSSGVGLTAAVTQDQETGERRLEAGAMVLADRGIVCIDEFDKMSDADRVAIHEVMEQQTITIAKAGIHTTLNARCSVVAAANPAYGQYDEKLEPHRNIRLPDSLLSRFDLLFVILDKTDEATDRSLSEHVLRMHRYLPPGVEEGQPLPASMLDPQFAWMDDATAGGGAGEGGSGEATQDDREAPVFVKAPNYQHASQASTGTFVDPDLDMDLDDDDSIAGSVASRTHRRRAAQRAAHQANEQAQILSLMFMKKYLHYAKSRIKPVLTPEASEVITNAYAEFRNTKANEEGRRRTLPITARTLETLIRLATAHAKARLAREVEEADAEAACELVEYALFKEFRRKRRPAKAVPGAGGRKRRKVADDADDDDDDDDGDIGDGQSGGVEDDGLGTSGAAGIAPARATPSTASASAAAAAAAGPAGLATDLDAMDIAAPPSPSAAAAPEVDAALLAHFKRALDAVFQETNGVAAVDDLPRLVNRMGTAVVPGSGQVVTFSAAQVRACLMLVEAEGNVMVADGEVYRV